MAKKQKATLVAKMKHEQALKNQKLQQLQLKQKLRKQRKQKELEARKAHEAEIARIKKEAVLKEKERAATEAARTKEAIALALQKKLQHHAELMDKRKIEHQKKIMLA